MTTAVIKFHNGTDYRTFRQIVKDVEELHDLESTTFDDVRDEVRVGSLDYDLYRLELEAIIEQNGGWVEFEAD